MENLIPYIKLIILALAGRVLVLAAAWPLLEEIGQKIGSIAG